MNKVGTFAVGFPKPGSAVVEAELLEEAFPVARFAMLAFALFSYRMWSNLGNNSQPARKSALTMGSLTESDLDTVLTYATRFKRPGKADPAYGPLEIVDEPMPKRRFEGVVEQRGSFDDAPDVGLFTSSIMVKGFGLFNSEVDYYAPAAVLALPAFLNTWCPEISAELVSVAQGCARVWLAGGVGMVNQHSLASYLVGALENPAFAKASIEAAQRDRD